jgi:23S rRNA (cytidine1920-2'-O)/16S rRNA (cytidine1409-2'-O)-methyltransferase
VSRERLDRLLVDRGLCESRERAQRLIRAGRVRVDGQPAPKPGHLVSVEAAITVSEPEPFVSRGGGKLEAALRAWPIDPGGRVAIDVGASTGGFTDCLLQHGACRVYAVDVGRGQLHWSLRNDPRVVVMEGVNARYLEPHQLPEAPSLAVMDVAFISLTRILPSVTPLLTPGADVITLIKPQFEAGRAQVGKGGVVRDPAVRQEVIDRIRAFGTGNLPMEWMDVRESPVKGPAGNVEYLAWWKTHSSASA